MRGQCGMQIFFPSDNVILANAAPCGKCKFLEERLRQCGMQIFACEASVARRSPTQLRVPCERSSLRIVHPFTRGTTMPVWHADFFSGPPQFPCECPSLWAMHPLPRGTTKPTWHDISAERPTRDPGSQPGIPGQGAEAPMLSVATVVTWLKAVERNKSSANRQKPYAFASVEGCFARKKNISSKALRKCIAKNADKALFPVFCTQAFRKNLELKPRLAESPFS